MTSERKIRVLITESNSYIGTSLARWLLRNPDTYQVDTLDMTADSWREHDFSMYDTIFHVAGIAHVSADKKLEPLYYRVNRDLCLETAQKAKREGVSQFIFMSSMIVYGETGSNSIDWQTIPKPTNFYGRSKLEAEEGLTRLSDAAFVVTILRPPVIYGRGSRGNYPRLAKLARWSPVFPDYPNRKSMLHIDNLCQLVQHLIDDREGGIYLPQNAEYVRTSELVRLIAEAHGKRMLLIRNFNPLIRSLVSRSDLVRRVFGDLYYDQAASAYKTDYQIRDLRESVTLTECDQPDTGK